MRLRKIDMLSKGPEAQRPRRIKLFVNRPTLGFEDAQAAEEPEAAAIVYPCGDSVWRSVTIPLKPLRFQNVSSLHVRFFLCFVPPCLSSTERGGVVCVWN